MCNGNYELNKKIFTKEMRKDYTILMPQMAPIHFEFLESAMKNSGYKMELLRDCTQHTVETGLKYVNNDACYPSILVTGQMIEALESGKYDLNKTALIMSQTGGGCRATNYIGFIRKALKDAGFENVPVISFNVVGMEKMPGFKLTIPLIERLIKSCIYADLLQKMLTKNRAYEINKGKTKELFDYWMEKCKKLVNKSSIKEFKQSIFDIVSDFEKIEIDTSVIKPKVGIVGEVLIKYHPFGNNFVADKLEQEGAEVILPDFMGFIKFIATHKITFNKLIKTDAIKAKLFKTAIKLIDLLEKPVISALNNSKKGYLLPCNIWDLEGKVNDILSIGNQTGEDNELNREIGVEILQMTGAEVETAENGKIAVEKVEASPEGLYDLVFMDIQMPVMNGYEATAAIRSLSGEKGKLPIVAMTANAFAEDVQLAKNTGMNGHIAKPLDMNKLNDVLESWL